MVRRLIILAVLAGCAGESTTSDTSSQATAQPTSTTAPTTVAPTTSASTPTTTVAPTTSTTIAPTTTLEPLAQIAADIERDLNLGEQALLDASADPSSERLRITLARYYTGRNLERVIEIADEYVANDYVTEAEP